VPPAAVTVAVPVAVPSQVGSVLAVIEALTADAGCVIVALLVVVQPLASVTVTSQVSADNPVAV